MTDPHHPKQSHWERVRRALRDAGVNHEPGEEHSAPPLGFATRMVSRMLADGSGQVSALATWRRCSVTGAACALILVGGSTILSPGNKRTPQLIPVPALEELPTLPQP